MEIVAAHPFLGHFAGKREQLRYIRLMPMERGIEAGNLRQVWRLPPYDPDRLRGYEVG